VFVLQLRNCANEGMCGFCECSTYFVVNDLILLFVALVELLGMRVLLYCLLRFWLFVSSL
jgi:hypothetical protein